VAEKASRAKSAFLSNMSHELRTPLNAILGFAQLMESSVPPQTDTQQARLHKITEAGWYLLKLINEILDLATIESGKLTLALEAVPLAEAVRKCCAMIEAQAQQRGIRINFLPFDESWFVNADRLRLKQILLNLLSNALKYNSEQGAITVKCTSTAERIRISVTDSGAGLSAEKMAQLFQPFNRIGQENCGEEGTGIGLVLSKRLVELMGGVIGAESTVGVGSEFWIELPQGVAPQPAKPAAPAALALQNIGNTGQHTLLCVEDDPASLLLIEQIVREAPHLRLLSAGAGNAGIALARTHLPDVILMDVNLPDISGIEALQTLRKDAATAHIPVIALTASATCDDVARGLDAEFFEYLTKPIKIDELMSTLDDALLFSEMRCTHTNATGE
jgi:CheY-like chemotaxis protein/two-component sensor histidine kinase